MGKEATNQADTDAKLCPVCQQSNQCALAQGAQQEQCWCVNETFPPALLQQLQEREARWCVCKQCLEKAQGVNYAG